MTARRDRQAVPQPAPRTSPPGLRTAVPVLATLVAAALAGCSSAPAGSAEGAVGGGEASLVLPDLSQATTAIGIDGRLLLVIGMGICLLGLGFGLMTFLQLRALPVHRSMLEVSELIYTTCKAYLARQGASCSCCGRSSPR